MIEARAKSAALSSLRYIVITVIIALLGLLPIFANILDQPYFVTLFSRVVIFALAALSLAIILGFGGMVSFGHALYLGVGAYAVGILSFHGITSGWVHLAATLGASAAIAAATGLVCLRTTGIGFIMITLAFAQMFFFLVVSLKHYGGDDGLSIDARSDFSPVNIQDNVTFYYVVLCILMASLYLAYRLVNSSFGMVLRGCKTNERRMRALGFPTVRYKLVAYVLSAMLCGVSGLLLANLTKYVSPEYISWVRSGDLILMIVIGGTNTLFGAVVGAIALLSFEEILSSYTDRWMAVLGILIFVMVLTTKQGLYGWFLNRIRSRAG